MSENLIHLSLVFTLDKNIMLTTKGESFIKFQLMFL